MLAQSDISNGKLQHVDVGDIKVAFSKTGEGPAVVMVHGLAEDHSSWKQVISLIKAPISIYAVDLRGHGETTAGEGNGTVEQLAADLLRFIESVTGSAICVGFSLGGVIVLEAALQRPDLVRQAIVVGTSSKVGRAAASFFEERISQAESDLPTFFQALESDTAGQIVSKHEQVQTVARQRIAAVGDAKGYINAAKAMVGLSQAPMTERLGAIQVPVHVVQGERDHYCPQKAADILLAAMPSAQLVVIPDAGHLMAVDQPEQLAAAIAKIF
ncbi:alpha/beta fold hydrolase [Advenella sp. RU8]|uniref:alpha/beta fold hydrolase n=1 Tax=Advenella sp. RU8 TaxID=3399575 RepID=UPI003AB03694